MYGQAVPHFKRETQNFCRKASLPFSGEMDLGCGITFDIFTYVFTRVCYKFIKTYKKKEIQVDDLGEGYNVVITTNKKMYSNHR